MSPSIDQCLTNCSYHSNSAALCPVPFEIGHGTFTSTGNSVGDTATYNCNTGFQLIGTATVDCIQLNVNSAAFSPAPPECRREYNHSICRT